MPRIYETVKFEVVIGVPDDKFINGKYEDNIYNIEDNIYNINKAWMKYAKEFYEKTQIYVSAISVNGKALYNSDWGCPPEGERTITFNCTANRFFIDDLYTYEEGVLYIAEKLKEEFKQHTITITKIPSYIWYYADEEKE